ncbi:MAG TPA: autotransporter domain-containing protein [Gammaproteobacteria bacterium]|nr:autotransporter domain-containing protein [Gammaproteobacteria bacterium]
MRALEFKKSLTFAFLTSSIFFSNAIHAQELITGAENCSDPGSVCTTEGVLFTGDFLLTVNNGDQIGNVGGVSAETINANQGQIAFQGTSIVTGSIGTSLLPINGIGIQGAGKTVTFVGDVYTKNGIGFDNAVSGSAIVQPGVNLNTEVFTLNPGTGIVTYQGNSTTAGNLGDLGGSLEAVNVNAGTLNLGHGIFATDTTVNAGAALNTIASNTITGNLIIDGTVNLNTNTLTVTGDAPISATGNLQTTLTNAPSNGKLAIGGTATCTNCTVTVNVSGDSIATGKQFTVVDGGVYAGDLPVIIGNNATYNFVPSTDNTDLFLTVTRTPFTDTATDPNLAGVAGFLEGIAFDTLLNNPEFAPLIQSLSTLDAAQFQQALSTLIPISDGSIMTLSHLAVDEVLLNISQRLATMSPMFASMQAGNYAAGDWDTGAGNWIQIFGNDVNHDARSGFAGFDAWNAGFAIGFDKEWWRNVLIGIGFSYAYTDVDSKAAAGNNLDIQTYNGFIYGNWRITPPIYWDAVLSVAYHDYDTNRYIVSPGVPPINVRAEGEFGAWQGTFFTELGYELLIDHWFITPHINFKYSHLDSKRLEETGAGALNLSVEYDDVNEVVLGGGLRLGYIMEMDYNVQLMPHLRAQVFHDFENDAQISTANFVGLGGAFVTPGLSPDDTTFRVGAGLDVACPHNWYFTINYDYKFRDDFDAHGGWVKFRWEWV